MMYKSKRAQNGEAALLGAECHLEETDAHDEAIELIPVVLQVDHRGERDQLEEELDRKGDREELRHEKLHNKLQHINNTLT